MKYIGIFSGKVYSEEEKKDMKECGIPINDETAQSDTLVKLLHESKKQRCNGCSECPMSREAAGKYSPYAELSGMNIEVILKNVMTAAYSAGFMDAIGRLNINGTLKLTEFIIEEFLKWNNDGKTVCFNEYIRRELIAKYGVTNDC